jgi:hypothetical protein
VRGFILVFGLFMGCAPMNAVLTTNGRAVRVVHPDSVKGCQYIGPVVKRVGGNFQSFEKNVDIATTLIRNLAGRKGATHMVMEPPRATNKHTWVGQGKCMNCVEAMATAYRCR